MRLRHCAMYPIARAFIRQRLCVTLYLGSLKIVRLLGVPMDTLQCNKQGYAHRSAVGMELLNVNIDTLLCNLNSAFNPLHRDCLLNYHVTAVNSGQVCMSVVMPSEMLRSFSMLLESMGGFFRVVNGKARASSATVKAHDLDTITERDRLIEAFKTEVCTLFDNHVSQGHAPKEAIKLTNADMKAQKSPWASHDIIKSTLRAMGRLRKQKGG